MATRAPSECRRSVLSCARCRKRKIKCDRCLPCSQCKTSNSACTGYSHVGGGTEVPRSIVQYLEAEIAALEKELGFDSGPIAVITAETYHLHGEESHEIPHDPSFNLSDAATFPCVQLRRPEDHDNSAEVPSVMAGVGGPLDTQDPVRQHIVSSKDITAMISATTPTGPSVTDVVSRVRMGLTPSLALSCATRNKSHSRHFEVDEVGIALLAGLPTQVVHGLVRKYVRMILPTFPCLYEPTVWEQLNRVLREVENACQNSPQQPTVKPSYDFLVIYLILAISATLGIANNPHQARCRALSESLFREGINHYSSKAPFPTDLAEIQATLLVLQYALVDPASANVWILSGATMRSCLELGLHRDLSGTGILDPLEIDLRRRVFWTAYCIDRSICSALQRPLSIPDPAIQTQFLSGLSDHCITPGGINPDGPATKTPALQWIEYSRLKSVMLEVHFQGKALKKDQTWEEWLQHMEEKLHDWHDRHDEGSSNNRLPGVNFPCALTNLHRPSPRVPIPSPNSLLVAFKAACVSARSYREQILSGFFRCPWLDAHNMLEMAMVVLFCLRHGYETISPQFSPSEIFEMTKLFTLNLLSISEQGWTDILKYAGIYERLLGPLLEFVFAQSNGSQRCSPCSFTTAHEAELNRLLYPGPAQLEKLRFGSSRKTQVAPDLSAFNVVDTDIFEYWDAMSSDIPDIPLIA